MSIVRRPSALEDLVDLADHIALNNIEAAGRFIRAAEEAFHDLDRMLFMGSRVSIETRNLRNQDVAHKKDFGST